LKTPLRFVAELEWRFLRERVHRRIGAELEQENRRLKAAVAELTLEKQALKDVLSRKF
jgi:hypothetical protein